MRSRATAVVVATLVLAVTGAGAAQAHTEVLRSIPSPGERLDAPVDQVALTFLDPVGTDVSIDVVDEAEVPVPGLTEASLDNDARTAAVRFAPLTRSGAYVVTYRFSSLDGDRQLGTYRFTYRAASADDESRGSTALAGLGVVGVVAVVGLVTAIRRRRHAS